jgi:hypothetical protein
MLCPQYETQLLKYGEKYYHANPNGTVACLTWKDKGYGHALLRHCNVYRKQTDAALRVQWNVETASKLAAAAERERYAQLCGKLHYRWHWNDDMDSDSGPRNCAKAIRAQTQD